MYSNEAKKRGAGGSAGRDAFELQRLDLGAGSRRYLRSLTWLFRVASAVMRRAACNVHTEITAWSIAPPARAKLRRPAAPPPGCMPYACTARLSRSIKRGRSSVPSTRLDITNPLFNSSSCFLSSIDIQSRQTDALLRPLIGGKRNKYKL